MQSLALAAADAAASPRAPWFRAVMAMTLLYPWIVRGSAAIAAHDRTAAALVLALCCVGPGLAVATIRASVRRAQPDPAELRARVLAHVAFTTPAAYTLLGVVAGLLGAPTVVPMAWVVLVGIGLLLSRVVPPRAREVARPRRRLAVRVAHGVAAVPLLLFVAAHLVNHLVGLFGGEAHARVMTALRVVYRAAPVEALLVGSTVFLLGSGLALIGARIAGAKDDHDVLRTVSAAYLAVFGLSHTLAVFGLGRVMLGVDTDWTFARGGPDGPWSAPHLLPYYGLAVFLTVAHAGVGLREVLREHRLAWADRAANVTIVLGALAASAVTVALAAGR